MSQNKESMGSKFGRWDIPGIVGTLLSAFAIFRGKSPEPPIHAGEIEVGQKVVSSLKAMTSKVDEGMWMSLMSALTDPKEQQAITSVLTLLDRPGEVDSLRLSIVNAPGATTVVEVPDPADATKKTKKTVKAGEYSDQDNRVLFLKSIAATANDPLKGPAVARDFLRTHRFATENVVTRYGPAVLNQITQQIPVRSDADLDPGFLQHALTHYRGVTIALVVGTILCLLVLAIKTLST